MSSHRRFPRLLALASLPFLALVVVPLVALVARTEVGELGQQLVRADALRAIGLSLSTASLTVTIAVLFGTPLGYLLGRSAFPGRSIVDSLVDLPMVLPPSVAGVALLVAFGRRGLVGHALESMGVHIAFTTAAVVLAQLFVAAPYFVRAAAGAFARVDRDLEDSAALDGATPWRVFRHITAPLVLPTLGAGAVMTWARALGEFGATIIFAGNYPGRTQTMPLAIYIGFEIDLDLAIALSVALLALSFAVLTTAKRVVRSGALVD